MPDSTAGGSGADSTAGGGGADSTAGGGGADSTAGGGGADSTGAGTSPLASGLPDITWIASQLDATFYTTQAVVDQLGTQTPSNLIVQSNLCEGWGPTNDVRYVYGTPTLSHGAFELLSSAGEYVLGACDQLQIAISEDGIKLTNVKPKTLASEIGLKTSDVLVSINGISALKFGSILTEIDRLAIAGGTAMVVYTRAGRDASLRVIVE